MTTINAYTKAGADQAFARKDLSDPETQDALFSAFGGLLVYLGLWDASTNSPAIIDGVGEAGSFYQVTIAGTADLGSGDITFEIGDFVCYDGTIWTRIPNSSVNPVSEETNLRIVRGTIDTTGPTILEPSPSGDAPFTVTGGGTGQTLVTFKVPFSDIPSVVMTAKDGGGGLGPIAGHHAAFVQTALEFKIGHTSIGTGYVNGIVHFIAMGPK